MASMSSEEDVQNVPVIHRATLCYILLSSYRLLTMGAPLKNQSWKP